MTLYGLKSCIITGTDTANDEPHRKRVTGGILRSSSQNPVYDIARARGLRGRYRYNYSGGNFEGRKAAREGPIFVCCSHQLCCGDGHLDTSTALGRPAYPKIQTPLIAQKWQNGKLRHAAMKRPKKKKTRLNCPQKVDRTVFYSHLRSLTLGGWGIAPYFSSSISCSPLQVPGKHMGPTCPKWAFSEAVHCQLLVLQHNILGTFGEH